MNKTQSWFQKLLLCGCLIFGITPAHAQITTDNTLGAEVSRLTPNMTIKGNITMFACPDAVAINYLHLISKINAKLAACKYCLAHN